MTRAPIIANLGSQRRRLPSIPLTTRTTKVTSVGVVVHLHGRAPAAVLGCRSTVAAQGCLVEVMMSSCIRGTAHQVEDDDEAEQHRGAATSLDASTASPIPRQG